MTDINEWRAKTAYNHLCNDAMDSIDAALFTGDMFRLESNREHFRYMMDRWESKLIQIEQNESN